MTCPQCSRENAPKANFCSYCGHRFGGRTGASRARSAKGRSAPGGQSRPTPDKVVGVPSQAEPAAPQAPAPPPQAARPAQPPSPPASPVEDEDKTMMMSAVSPQEVPALKPSPAPISEPDEDKTVMQAALPADLPDDEDKTMVSAGVPELLDNARGMTLAGAPMPDLSAIVPGEGPAIARPTPVAAPAPTPPEPPPTPAQTPTATAPPPPPAAPAIHGARPIPPMPDFPASTLQLPRPGDGPVAAVSYSLRYYTANSRSNALAGQLDEHERVLEGLRARAYFELGERAWREQVALPQAQAAIQQLNASSHQLEQARAALRQARGAAAPEIEQLERNKREAEQTAAAADNALAQCGTDPGLQLDQARSTAQTAHARLQEVQSRLRAKKQSVAKQAGPVELQLNAVRHALSTSFNQVAAAVLQRRADFPQYQESCAHIDALSAGAEATRQRKAELQQLRDAMSAPTARKGLAIVAGGALLILLALIVIGSLLSSGGGLSSSPSTEVAAQFLPQSNDNVAGVNPQRLLDSALVADLGLLQQLEAMEEYKMATAQSGLSPRSLKGFAFSGNPSDESFVFAALGDFGSDQLKALYEGTVPMLASNQFKVGDTTFYGQTDASTPHVGWVKDELVVVGMQNQITSGMAVYDKGDPSVLDHTKLQDVFPHIDTAAVAWAAAVLPQELLALDPLGLLNEGDAIGVSVDVQSDVEFQAVGSFSSADAATQVKTRADEGLVLLRTLLTLLPSELAEYKDDIKSSLETVQIELDANRVLVSATVSADMITKLYQNAEKLKQLNF